jgi:hypothetical protein
VGAGGEFGIAREALLDEETDERVGARHVGTIAGVGGFGEVVYKTNRHGGPGLGYRLSSLQSASARRMC